MINKRKTLAVVGLGYVGLPLALLAAEKGWMVTGVDIDKRKIDLIAKKKPPFLDHEVEKRLRKTKLKVTTDFSEIKNAAVVIVCVPTPVFTNRRPDYGPVKGACTSVAANLSKGQLVILESTVNPGVCEDMVVPILEDKSKLKAGKDFFVAHCPERINPGDPKWNVSNIPRVVGALDKKSLAKALTFYRSVLSTKIKPMSSLKEAEAVKMVENSFRNVNIAFVNELAKSFSKMGIDAVSVINGAATKPFSFMAHYPGCGIGGHCIPVDPYYLIDYAKKKYGFDHKLLKLACATNEGMPEYTVGLVEKGLKEKGLKIKGTKVAVLGIAYKGGVGDIRESPAIEIIKILKKKGAKVVAFDPFILDKSDAKDLDSALSKAKAVVVATDHNAFKKIKVAKLKKYGVKVVVDGRNCLDGDNIRSVGIYYSGIGR